MEIKEIEHLLQLARIEITQEEKEKLSSDLENILNYVKQLEEINTDKVEPMSGGSFLENVVREDEMNPEKRNLEKEGYFVVPPIFE
ncbi:MAG: Asp-tRNA(Asn)/Glu-tRNA(Gln) amidotransferase subunit GatC [Minisyncoccia bacterium]